MPRDLADAAPAGRARGVRRRPGVVTIAALEAAPYVGRRPTGSSRRSSTSATASPSLVILRGCDELEEAKLGSLGFALCRPATPEEIEPVMGAKPGSLGTVKGTIKNPRRPRRHLRRPRDPPRRQRDDRAPTGTASTCATSTSPATSRSRGSATSAACGRASPIPIGGRPLKVRRGIEVGHIFKLGTKYSERIDAGYTDDKKERHLFVMGCYGIGISRTLQAVIEQSHDADGIVWPWAIAPFQVLVCLLDPQDAEATAIAREARRRGGARGRRRAGRRPGGAARA